MRAARRVWAFLTRPEVYWRLFSLLLAVLLWLLAAGDGSLGEAERTVNLAVEVQNLPADLVLVEPPESVKVRIRGLTPLLNRGEGAISASINLAGAQEGTETYNVEVTAPLGIQILGVTPGWVSVYTEELQEAAFPVTLALLGVERAELAAQLKPQPPVVTLKGARSMLEQVDHVVAYLNVGEIVKPGSAFPVRALDSQGRGIPAVDIDPPQVTVELEQTESNQTEEE